MTAVEKMHFVAPAVSTLGLAPCVQGAPDSRASLLIMTLLVKKPVYTTSRLWTLGVFCHFLWRRVPEVATGDLDDF